MRAAVIAEPGAPWVLTELPDPEPGPGQVVVRVRASGLCHNDVYVAQGVFPFPRYGPAVVGHEAAGEVVAVGAGVVSRRVGDRVGTTWVQATCGRCEHCLLGLPLGGQGGIHCPASTMTGLTVPGGHAEYVTTTAASTVLLPESLSYEHAAPLLCAGYTAWSGLRAAEPRPGDRIAVVGIGGLGHLAVQFSRATGHETVAVTRSPDKVAALADLGADTVVSSGAELAEVGGADIVLVTGTSYAAATDALAGLRVNGRLVLATIDPADAFIIPPSLPFWARRQTVVGATHDGLDRLVECLDLAAQGRVRPVVEVHDCTDVDLAAKRVEKGEARFRAIVTY